MTLPPIMAEALEHAINHCLSLDDRALARLAALSGKVIALEPRGLPLRLYLLPGEQGVRLLDDYDGEPDAVLRGAPLALLRLGAAGEGRDALFGGEVQIEGDVELGRRFGVILQELDIDWEEQLSWYLGDVPAHQLGRAARAGRDWAREAIGRLGRDAAEYLQQESDQLPPRIEVEAFLAAVDQLRADVDRLGARIARLQRQPPKGHA